MATLVLFHSALGLRPAVGRFADRLRAHGHEVRTPDLYDGRVFDDLDEGVAFRDELGVPTLMQRAVDAVTDLPGDIHYAGMSMGVAPAQLLAATRPGASGAFLIHGGLPLELFGLDRWPPSVPVQLHVSPEDPWVDQAGLDALVATLPPAARTVVWYSGTGHLFTDDGSEEHDASATDRVLAAAATFLEGR
jgi:dienelactone hydrolase